MSNYTRTIIDLRNNLHRDITQKASLHDIEFEGDFIFEQPVEESYLHTLGYKENEARKIIVCGITSQGYLFGTDRKEQEVYIKYNDLSLEVMDGILNRLQSGKFRKVARKLPF